MNKTNEIKFSVIIPSYNTELYINECLESVINQNYKNIEIIVVDDGSMDNTYSIIEQYYNKYPKMFKIEKTCHLGVSHSRNIALKKATGDYIIFLDSDDYLEPKSLRRLNNILKKYLPDVMVGEFNCITEDEKIPILKSEILNSSSINNQPPQRVLNYFYSKRLIFTLWRFVVKRELIDYNLLLREDVIHEDEEWVPRMLIKMKSFRKIPFRHYVYRKRKNSIMSSKNMYNYHSMLKIADELLYLSEEQDEDYKKYFLMRNAYKLAANAYRDLRRISKPRKGLKYYKN